MPNPNPTYLANLPKRISIYDHKYFHCPQWENNTRIPCIDPSVQAHTRLFLFLALGTLHGHVFGQGKQSPDACPTCQPVLSQPINNKCFN